MANVILPSGANSGDFPWPAGASVPLVQLHAWTGLALYSMMRNNFYQEATNGPNIPQVSAFRNLTADKSDRLIIRSSLRYSVSGFSSAQKEWLAIETYPELPLVFPASFKTAS